MERLGYPARRLASGLLRSGASPGKRILHGSGDSPHDRHRFRSYLFIGKSLGGRNTAVLLLGTVGAAVAFHLITNGAAWPSADFSEDTAGLWQSFWGVPARGRSPELGFPPQYGRSESALHCHFPVRPLRPA